MSGYFKTKIRIFLPNGPPMRFTMMGMAMQDYGLGLRVGLKDLPTLRTRLN